MEILDQLRKAIQTVFAAWETLPRVPNPHKIVSVQDLVHDRYSLLDVVLDTGFDGWKHDAHVLAYLEIRRGKILGYLNDDAELGEAGKIATDLVLAGVPKQQIVLGFYNPSMRVRYEFAIT